MLQPKYCPICGKEFYPRPGWAYKREGELLCSWKCLREAEKQEKESEENK